MPQQPIAVFDANVIIPLSLVSRRSLSTQLLLRLKAAGHIVAISRELLEEVADKMRTKKTLRKWLQLPSQPGRRWLHGGLECIGAF